jgi:hypothetical protein
MSKTPETPVIVNDETAEVSENDPALDSAVQAVMQKLQEEYITKMSFYKRAAIIAGAVGATALAIGIAIGRSSSSDDTDEETETSED